jgi:hypothetical protein
MFLRENLKKMLKNYLNAETLKKIIDDGGATLDHSGAPVSFRTGYQVSKKDCYILKVKNIKAILKAVNKLLNGCKFGEFVGLWVDDEKIYIDISEHIKNYKNAFKVGTARKQLSVFDWAANNCIYL